jgi:hypothetical protein
MLSVAVLCVVAFVLPGNGRGQDFFREGDYSLDVQTGYHHATVHGYRGKVGEYEALDSGMDASFDLAARSRRNHLDVEGDVRDENDQRYLMEFDGGRIFETETSYTRYRHYLDHDPLDNQDFFTDFDAGRTNAIIREEMQSENIFRIPFMPGLKLRADFRELNKRGHRQATTVNKCTQCHVTSRDKRINQSTQDLKLGADITVRSLTLSYTHMQRAFNEGGASPIAYYGFESPDFPVKGFREYSSVADARTYTNHFKARTELPLQSSFAVDYALGENHNRETGYERDSQNFAVRLSTAALRYLTLNFHYHDYNQDNNVPDTLERDVTRSSISFKTRPWKRNYLTGSYVWEDTDRRDSASRSTLRKVVRLSFLSKPHRDVELNIRYRNEQTDDPFVNEEWELFRSLQTSEPTRGDEVHLALNWTPRANLSLSPSARYEQADSSSYDIDEKRLEMMISLWYAFRDNLILTGSYSLIDTDIDTRTAYKNYHGVWRSDYLFDRSTPYNDRSNCYHLTLNYRFSRTVACVGSVMLTDSNADFDSSIYDNNIGEFSDLNIERLDTSLGMEYFYKPNLTFYARYNYRDYNDREINDLDGRLHFMSLGAKYTF